MDDNYRCQNCDLNFPDKKSLEKHKDKFCSSISCGLFYPSNSWTDAVEPSSDSYRNKDSLKKQEVLLQKQKKELLKQLEELGVKHHNSKNYEQNKIPFYVNALNEGNHSHQYDKGIKSRQKYVPSNSLEKKQHSGTIPQEEGNKLLREARQMCNEYIQNGGNDKRVFDYFSQMERNIETFKERNQQKDHKDGNPDYLNDLEKQVSYYEARNKMLENELQIMRRQEEMEHHQQKIVEAFTKRSRYKEDYDPNLSSRNQIQSYNQNPYQQQQQQPPLAMHTNGVKFHEQRLMDMRQETEYYRQQLELEHIRQQLYCLRGNPNKPVLPGIGGFQQHYPAITYHDNQQQHRQQKQQQHQYQQQQNIPFLHNSINNQIPLQKQQSEAFQQAPYDPGSGFTLFLDFVSIDATSAGYFHLLVTMYKSGEQVSASKSLPIAPYGFNTQANNFNHNINNNNNNNGSVAIVGVKQLFPKCFPDLSLSLVVCLRTNSVYSQDQITLENSMEDYGWCKIDLFNSFNCVMAGRWKTPFRSFPVQPDITTVDLNLIPQVGDAELFYRLVNSRDANIQEATILNSRMMIINYKYPPIESCPLLKFPKLTLEAPLPIKLVTPIVNLEQSEKQRETSANIQLSNIPSAVRQQHEAIPRTAWNDFVKPPTNNIRSATSIKENSSASKLPSLISFRSPLVSHVSESSFSLTVDNIAEVVIPSIDCNIGIQLDHIFDLSVNPLKVHLSIYNPDGKVACCDDGETIFSSNWAKPSFLNLVQHFSLHEKLFSSVQLFQWSALYVVVVEQNEKMNENVIAWSVLPLFDHYHSNSTGPESSMSQRQNTPLLAHHLKSGVLKIPLYKPPTINLKDAIEKMKVRDSSCFVPTLKNSFICVNIYRDEHQKKYQSCTIPPVPHIEQPPKNAWIEHVRDKPSRLFRNGDGFDVYVDGGRYFPDSTVAAKVVVGYFDGSGSRKNPFTSTYETNLSVDMSSMEPTFDARFEFRELAYLPQTKLIFKVFLLNGVTKKVCLYGHCIVPLFVKTDTFEYAGVSSQTYCLNEGGQQLKLYRYLEDTVFFDQNKLKGPIPCSSLLVRILPAACYSDGEPKSLKEIPEDEWINEGILVPMPPYEEGQYDSMQCQPCDTEIGLLHHFFTRKEALVKYKAREISPDGKKTRTDHGLLEWLKTQFKTLNGCLLMDMRFFVKYNTYYGLFFDLQRGQNLPWNGFTVASYCISPPACFYYGVVDDPLMQVFKVSENSLQKHVHWTDGLKFFPRRMHFQNLAIIIQLYEVTSTNGEFVFLPQAWTLLPLLTCEYILHGVFQVPVFRGSPSESVLSAIQHQPLIPTMATLRKKNVLKVMDGASLFVRAGDPRRLEDLDDENIPVDQTFLPCSNKFLNATQSKPVKTVVPADMQYNQYVGGMGIAFDRYIKGDFQRRTEQSRQTER